PSAAAPTSQPGKPATRSLAQPVDTPSSPPSIESGLGLARLASGPTRNAPLNSRKEASTDQVVMSLVSVLPSDGTTTSLLEREVQVAALRALADATQSGGGRFVVIEG